MPKKLKRNKQQRAKEAQSCIKISSRKMTRLEHVRQNTFKSLTNSDNKNCSEFVMFNRKATFENFDRKLINKINDFAKTGFQIFYF